MSLYDEFEMKKITDLDELESIKGDEYILIQSEEYEETQKMSVAYFVEKLIDYIRLNKISMVETDPTVPDFVKNITEEDIEKWNTVVQVARDIEDLKIPKVKIKSFICEPATALYGNVLDKVVLKWETNNKTIDKIVVMNGGDSYEVSPYNHELTITKTIDSDQVFSIIVTDDGGNQDVKDITLDFYNGVYYGTSVPTEITNEFINSMEYRITNKPRFGFTVLSREDEYIYFAYPKRLGGVAFMIDTEYADFEYITTFDFTNEHNYTEPYYVYRSVSNHLGQTTVIVV